VVPSSRLQNFGGFFGEKFGWERVKLLPARQPSRRSGADQREWGWKKPPYFDRVGEEHRATRERVALFDLTSFGKIEVSGPGALTLLNRVADAEMDKPVGTATYCQFINTWRCGSGSNGPRLGKKISSGSSRAQPSSATTSLGYE
jgi:4-methylaminobutanoate oxidase (formaldehyde-forming)